MSFFGSSSKFGLRLHCECPVQPSSVVLELLRLDEICVPLEVSLSAVIHDLALLHDLHDIHLSLIFSFVKMFRTLKHYFTESFLVSIFSLFVSFSSRCFAPSWSSGQFQISPQSRCSFRFTRLRLCVSVVLTLVTSVSIDTRHLCLPDTAVRHLKWVLPCLNLVLCLCNLFLST